MARADFQLVWTANSQTWMLRAFEVAVNRNADQKIEKAIRYEFFISFAFHDTAHKSGLSHPASRLRILWLSPPWKAQTMLLDSKL